MLVLKRFLAFFIDYIIIISYAILLFKVTILSSETFNFNLETINPIKSQFISFLTLTIPVILYSVLTERSSKKGTIGKWVTGICIEAEKKHILKRNILKYLPWEFAHTGVHWIYFYANKNAEIPSWIWVVLIIPQLIIVVYIITIIYTKGESSAYDKFSSTKIKLKKRLI